MRIRMHYKRLCYSRPHGLLWKHRGARGPAATHMSGGIYGGNGGGGGQSWRPDARTNAL